jgi:hypothetical protein
MTALVSDAEKDCYIEQTVCLLAAGKAATTSHQK